MKALQLNIDFMNQKKGTKYLVEYTLVGEIIRFGKNDNGIDRIVPVNKAIDSGKFDVVIIENWSTTEVECYLCSKKWTAIHESNCEELECPNCGYFTTIN